MSVDDKTMCIFADLAAAAVDAAEISPAKLLKMTVREFIEKVAVPLDMKFTWTSEDKDEDKGEETPSTIIDRIVQRANNSDGKAWDELRSLALREGFNAEEIEKAESWEELGRMIKNGKDEEPTRVEPEENEAHPMLCIVAKPAPHSKAMTKYWSVSADSDISTGPLWGHDPSLAFTFYLREDANRVLKRVISPGRGYRPPEIATWEEYA